MYAEDIVSTVLFELEVLLYCIPPQAPFHFTTNVWHGRLLLIEQELITGDSDDAASATQRNAYDGLRAKVELHNSVVSDEGNPVKQLFGEIWYNPSGKYKVANDGGETIEALGLRDFKCLVQLPYTGYHFGLLDSDDPDIIKDNADEPKVVQVALGVRFHSMDAALSFSEWILIYRRRFNNYQEQLNFDQLLEEMNDEFGEFMSFES
ncbi:hypothetical protein JNB11_08465 [Kocuria palustris]|nr:hypothetical protein [Kocuria palustris]